MCGGSEPSVQDARGTRRKRSLPLIFRWADGGDGRKLLGVELAVRGRCVSARLLGALHPGNRTGHRGMGQRELQGQVHHALSRPQNAAQA